MINQSVYCLFVWWAVQIDADIFVRQVICRSPDVHDVTRVGQNKENGSLPFYVK